MAWYDQTQTVPGRFWGTNTVFVHDYSGWSSPSTPAEVKGALAKTLRENDANGLVTKLSGNGFTGLQQLAAADANFAGALDSALSNNEDFVNAITGASGGADTQLTAILKSGTSSLTRPWAAQALTESLGDVATASGFDAAAFKSSVVVNARDNLKAHLSTLGSSAEVLTELKHGAQALAALGQPLPGETVSIMNYIDGNDIHPELKEAILNRFRTDPSIMDALMGSGGTGSLTRADMEAVSASDLRRDALVDVLNNTPRGQLDVSDLETAVRQQAVTNAQTVAAQFAGLSGDALYDALKNSDDLFNSAAERDAFFDRFELTDQEKIDLFKDQGFDFDPATGTATAIAGSAAASLSAADSSAKISSLRADIAEMDSDAKAMRSSFLHAFEKNEYFQTALIVASHEDPELMGKLLKDPEGTDIQSQFGIGPNVLSYIADNPDLDVTKLTEGLGNIPNFDPANMNYSDLQQMLRTIDFDDAGKHVFGLSNAIIQDNKGKLEDLWALGVDSYRNFFSEIQESIMNSNLSPEAKQAFAGLFKVIEELVPMMMEGIGMIANLGISLVGEVGRAHMVASDPLSNSGLMTGGQTLTPRQYSNMIANKLKNDINHGRDDIRDPEVSEHQTIRVRYGPNPNDYTDTTLNEIRDMSPQEIDRVFGGNPPVRIKPGEKLRSVFNTESVDYTAKDDGQDTEVTVKMPGSEAGAAFRVAVRPSPVMTPGEVRDHTRNRPDAIGAPRPLFPPAAGQN